MIIATNTSHPIQFYSNRFVNLKSLSIASGAVVCSTSFTNNSDSKLKDNQQIADLDEIQNMFNKIDVKTYERNDLQNQKRVGFIAQDFEAILPEYYKHIVGDGTIQRTTESEVEDIKTIDYSRICILWGSLKKSNKRIAELEEQILK